MPAPGNPTHFRWVIFSLACGTSWLLYLHRYTFALIKPKLVDQWDLSKVELGLLDSAFSLTSTGFQFPLGFLADACGVRIVLTCLILVWCLGLGLHAWAPSPRYLWLARATLGLGQSAVYACLSRMARTWFPATIRTTLQGLAGITAGRLGGMCANVLFATVLLGICGLDWRTATYVFVAVGVAFAALFFALFRNSPDAHPLVNEAEAALIDTPAGRHVGPPADAAANSQPLKLRQLPGSIRPAAVPNFFFLNIQTILSTFADNIYSNWIPLFLAEVYLLNDKSIGLFSALPLLGGAMGGALGGLLNDAAIAWTGNRRWSRSGIAACGKGLAAVLLVAALAWYHNPAVFCSLLFAVKFFGDWSLSTSWGVVTDIGGRATASVFAFNNTVAGVGLFTAPVVFGYLAQHHGWPAVFVAVAAAYVLCALSWLVIDCTKPLIDEPG
jgi:ACS family glucarate transporter-like MFS transporter